MLLCGRGDVSGFSTHTYSIERCRALGSDQNPAGSSCIRLVFQSGWSADTPSLACPRDTSTCRKWCQNKPTAKKVIVSAISVTVYQPQTAPAWPFTSANQSPGAIVVSRAYYFLLDNTHLSHSPQTFHEAPISAHKM